MDMLAAAAAPVMGGSVLQGEGGGEHSMEATHIAFVYMSATISSIVVGSTLWKAARVPGCDIIINRLSKCKLNWETMPARSLYETLSWIAITYSVACAYDAFAAILLGTGICIISCVAAGLSNQAIRLQVDPVSERPQPNLASFFLLHPLFCLTCTFLLARGIRAPPVWLLYACLFMWVSEVLCGGHVAGRLGARALNRIKRLHLADLGVAAAAVVASAFAFEMPLAAAAHLILLGFFVVFVVLSGSSLSVTPTLRPSVSPAPARDALCEGGEEGGENALDAAGNGPTPSPSLVHTRDTHCRIVRTAVRSEAPRIGVAGKWYDVGTFLHHHPGGTVLEEFYGKDATQQFEAFHPPGVISRFTPVGHYDFHLDDPLERDFRELQQRLQAEGWYAAPHRWYALKALFNTSLFAGFLAALWLLPVGDPMSSLGAFAVGIVLPGVCLGLFWQQSAFLAHDFMHNSVYGSRRKDQSHGWFWGNVCLGLSGTWWKDEHFEHHFFTNTVIPGVGCSDPQQYEAGVFVQDKMLRGFLPHRLCRYVVKLQRYTFLPIMFLVGRVAICIASYTMQKGRREWAGIALHWAAICLCFSGVPLWHAAGVWYVGSIVQGLLALQLCLSHYDKPFDTKEEVKGSWARRQATVIKDVTCPWYWDWVHGGLNYHLVHHLLPRMPRAKFRQANELVLALLRKHDVPIDLESFSGATCSILNHLRDEAAAL